MFVFKMHVLLPILLMLGISVSLIQARSTSGIEPREYGDEIDDFENEIIEEEILKAEDDALEHAGSDNDYHDVEDEELMIGGKFDDNPEDEKFPEEKIGEGVDDEEDKVSEAEKKEEDVEEEMAAEDEKKEEEVEEENAADEEKKEEDVEEEKAAEDEKKEEDVEEEKTVDDEKNEEDVEEEKAADEEKKKEDEDKAAEDEKKKEEEEKIEEVLEERTYNQTEKPKYKGSFAKWFDKFKTYLRSKFY